jgi:hypothetical protein
LPYSETTDGMFTNQVLQAIAETERGSFDRHALIERIAEHVACTSMVVRIGRGDHYVAEEFPDRPPGSLSLSRNQHEVLGILRVQHVMPILRVRFYNHDTRTIFFKAVIRCDVARHSIGHKLNSRALTVETHKITV